MNKNIKEMIELSKKITKEEIEKNERISEVINILEKYDVKYYYMDKYDVNLRIYKIINKENIEISEKYGNIYISRIKGNDNNYILNSEIQPNNELLMTYSHSTGPYMFGGSSFWGNCGYYDKELFDEYFNELKKYNYKYIDEINHSIYFDLDEGFKLYKNYYEICKKYQEKFNNRFNQYKIDKKKKELEQLLKESE